MITFVTSRTFDANISRCAVLVIASRKQQTIMKIYFVWIQILFCGKKKYISALCKITLRVYLMISTFLIEDNNKTIDMQQGF